MVARVQLMECRQNHNASGNGKYQSTANRQWANLIWTALFPCSTITEHSKPLTVAIVIFLPMNCYFGALADCTKKKKKND